MGSPLYIPPSAMRALLDEWGFQDPDERQEHVALWKSLDDAWLEQAREKPDDPKTNKARKEAPAGEQQYEFSSPGD